MISKEEILERVIGPHFIGDGTKQSVFEAMDMYAKQQAIAFLKWADREGYTLKENGRWGSFSDFYGKTDDELYQLFEQYKTKQP